MTTNFIKTCYTSLSLAFFLAQAARVGKCEIVTLLKDLTEKFDSLREDVNQLKGKQQQQEDTSSESWPSRSPRRSRSRSRRDTRGDENSTPDLGAGNGFAPPGAKQNPHAAK